MPNRTIGTGLAFPGGFGTLDELFEVITLVQTGKAKPVPIVLFGTDYWKRLFNTDVLLEEGVISPQDLDLFTYVDDPKAAWDVIRGFYGLLADEPRRGTGQDAKARRARLDPK